MTSATPRPDRTSRRMAVLGNSNIDLFFQLPRLPKNHEKLRTRQFLSCGGGAPANVAYWLSKLGNKIDLFSVVGADAFGEKSISDLRECGVNVDNVVMDKSVQTGLAAILKYGNTESMITTGVQGGEGYWREHVRSIISLEYDHIHCSGRWVSPLLSELTSRRDLKSRPTISTDLNGHFDLEIVQSCDISFTNCDELQRAIGAENWRTKLTMESTNLNGAVVVTQAGDGSTVFTRSEVNDVDVKAVSTLDRTGGGDAFCAAVLNRKLLGDTWSMALTCGHALAAGVITEYTSRPTSSLIKSIIASQSV